MINSNLLKVFICTAMFLLANFNAFKINITTIDFYQDAILIRYLKEKNTNIYNRLEELKIECNCFIIYEKDVSESIRFKIFTLSNSFELNNIIVGIQQSFTYIIQGEKIEYNQKIDSVFSLLKRVLEQDKFDVRGPDKRYVIELIDNVLRDSNLQSFRMSYLKENYSNISNIHYGKYVNNYPSKQVSLIINIILFFYFLTYISKYLQHRKFFIFKQFFAKYFN